VDVATVSHDRLKSAPAKVTRLGSRYFVVGVAWGAPIAEVEVRIDNGPWTAATLFGRTPLTKRSRGYAPRTTLNMAALAPMPSARVTMDYRGFHQLDPAMPLPQA
jgi:hypothetical protein